MANQNYVNISSAESLKAWFSVLPDDRMLFSAVVMAGRAAHRVIPLSLPRSGGIGERELRIVLEIFRANIVLRVASRRLGAELMEPARKSKNALSELQSKRSLMRISCPAAAVSSVFATTTDFGIAQSSGAIDFSVRMARGVSLGVGSSVWKAVRNDANCLENFHRPAQLSSMPIFVKHPSWWSRQCDSFWRDLLQKEFESLNFQIWKDWYESLIYSNSPFNLPNDIARNLEFRIALGDNRNDFWDREIVEINAEIASWVRKEWVRAEK